MRVSLVLSVLVGVALVVAALVGDPSATAATATSISVHVPDTTPQVGDRLVISGRVAPNARGHIVELQRLRAGHWQAVAHQSLSRYSRFRFAVRLRASGSRTYRVRLHSTAALSASASRAVVIHVAASRPNCTPGYSPCIPIGPDVDCAGGSGNGPRYVAGPIRVTGSDPYGLDPDGDSLGCETN